MAETTQRITELPASTSISGNFSFVTNDNGAARQVSKEILKSYLGVSLTVSQIAALNNLAVVGTGTKFFSDTTSGGGYRNISWADISNIPLGFTSFDADDFEVDANKKLSLKTGNTVIVDDILTSTSTVNALSANQGKNINDKVVSITGGTTKTDASKIQGVNISAITPLNNQTLVYNTTTSQYDLQTLPTNLDLNSLLGTEADSIIIGKNTELNTASFKLNIPNWKPHSDGYSAYNYYVGNYVLNDNKIYKCKADHINTLIFEDTNWDLIGGDEGIIDWVSGTSYALKKLVIYSNSIYQCTTANSDTVWTPANWECISNGEKGDTGLAGSQWFSGSTAPTTGMVLNDYWLSTATDTLGNIYKYTTDWSTLVCNISGNDGINGTNGTNGTNGNDGVDGVNGTDGTHIYSGTVIVGVSTTPTAYATGIIKANIDDIYQNTSTFNQYKCTLGGNAETALWSYVGSVKGADGTITVQSTALEYTGTLLANGWTTTAPYTQTVTISGLSDNMAKPLLDVVLSASVSLKIEENNQWSYIAEAETGTNTLTVVCLEKKPTITLNFSLKVV